MQSKKSSKVDLLEKKVKALINVVQTILTEQANLKDLAVGTLETIKKMPDYEKAIEDLKTELAKESSKRTKTKSNGETS
tara:strand:+ start:5583 stop:5819 length:237 start_codon:yes stop_codon:yes gene_type:complete